MARSALVTPPGRSEFRPTTPMAPSSASVTTALVRYQRSVDPLLHMRHAEVVGRAHRLLGEVDAERFDGLDRPNRFGWRIRLIVIDAHPQVIAELFAYAFHYPNVLGNSAAQLDANRADSLAIKVLYEADHGVGVHQRNERRQRYLVHDAATHEVARGPARDAPHHIIAGHVEQPLGDVAAGDVTVHAMAYAFDVERALAEQVLAERVSDDVNELFGRDTGLREPDERLSQTYGAGGGDQLAYDKVAAEPGLFGLDRHAKPSCPGLHGLPDELEKRHEHRCQFDAHYIRPLDCR